MPLKLANKQKKDSGSDSASGRKYRKFPRVLDSFIQLIKTVISFSTMYMCNMFFIKVPIIPKYLMQSFCLTRRIELMLKMCTSVTSCLIYNPFKKSQTCAITICGDVCKRHSISMKFSQIKFHLLLIFKMCQEVILSHYTLFNTLHPMRQEVQTRAIDGHFMFLPFPNNHVSYVSFSPTFLASVLLAILVFCRSCP